MNIWHDIRDERITPEEFIVVIEIPYGCTKKYEIDKETGMLMLDRIPRAGFGFPANYGFIPRTLSEDGDPLDALVISSETIDPMVLVPCRPIGLLDMNDNGEQDEKILCVPVKDAFYENTKDVGDLPPSIIEKIKYFYQVYKTLDKKNNKIELKPVSGAAVAKKIITEAKVLYNKKFGGKK